jgi:tetratricopeptide (TPR) repeat protein
MGLALLLAGATAADAQLLRIPQASPHARAEETFGITDVAIDYHRPAVNGRRIFGGLVPYGVLWRAGANENTLVSFSTPVNIEGQPLAAGTYSFFLLPGEKQWTAVFNRFTGGWGTYSYDAAEDVLRVVVTPQSGEKQERLLYTFDEPKEDSVTLTMRWDTTRVPVRITADTKSLAAASIRAQLRSDLHWTPQAWVEAARYALNHGDPDAALAYVGRAIELSPDAQSLRVKARIVEKKGDAKQAKELRDRAAAIDPEAARYSAAYGLIGAKKYDEAATAINALTAAAPRSWRAWVAYGDLLAAKGDRAGAMDAYNKAMGFAGDESERVEVQDSINALGAEPPK